ncbi:MAG: hypothetical protein HY976_02270 [Candidatus Kerfeldbacteria bacterium]|nr:hypothetical protein [Candidatus Kerfeldbacteria bacterium]
MTLVLMAAVVIIVVSAFDFTTSSSRTVTRRVNTQAATRLAEAAVEKAVWCLNNPSAPVSQCPNNPFYTGETNTAIEGGTFDVIVSGSGGTRTVVATGKVPGPNAVQQSVEVTLVTSQTTASFQYGVQAGMGGILMGNNAHINGNAYTNGSISGGSGSSITGDAILAVSSPIQDAVSNPSVFPTLYTKNIGDASSTLWLAQSFKSNLTDKVYSVDLKIAKHNNPTTTVTMYIYSDNAGTPGTNLSGAGQVLNVAVPADSPAGWENGWTNQIFNPSTILLADTNYWLVLKVSGSNSTKYWSVVRSNDDGTYGNGVAKIGAALTTLTPVCVSGCDIGFRMNVGGQYPTLEIPSVGGNAYGHKIDDTVVTGRAFYQELFGVVKANLTDDCTENENGPNCFDNSPDQPPQNFPISDAQIAQMEANAAAGGIVTCSPTCIIPTGSSVGPKKYVGDVLIDNNAIVTLTGTIWVEGDLRIDNNSILSLSAGYGTTSGTIIAHVPSDSDNKGRIVLRNNGDLRGNGNAGTYIMAISMNTDPSLLTNAIDVSNNLSAGVLFAPYGLITVTNNAALKEVTAQKLALTNNTSVTYETGLASVVFSSGPGGSWTYSKGSYQIL